MPDRVAVSVAFTQIRYIVINGSEIKRARTCVGCSNQSQKTDLIRIVRMSNSVVELDLTGRQPGRGAYVCSFSCLSHSLKNKRLERALKTAISEENAERLLDQAREAFSEEVG